MADLLTGTALVTGAASGIGRATTFAFARYGVHSIALVDINEKALNATVSELRIVHPNLRITAHVVDISREEDVQKLIGDIVQQFGRLDYAVNNAGVAAPAVGSHELTFAEMRAHIDINLLGVFNCQKFEIEQMLKQDQHGPGGQRGSKGVIVNMASMLGLISGAQTSPCTAYVTGKHAVLGLTKSDAVAYARDGIRINAVCPGYVQTPLISEASAMLESEIQKVPMGRLAEPEEIADAISFLASPMSSFMCGTSLVIDGGFTCI